MSPKLSVIIPVYNSERYLKRCLDSVMRQSFRNYEVIVINDGSSDNSCSICKEFNEKYENFTLINQTNHGVAFSRNEGMKICRGEYLTFADSDDFVDPDWLQSFVDVVNNNQDCDLVVEGIVVNNNTQENKVEIKSGKYYEKNIINAFRSLYYLNGFLFNKLYKTNLIKENNLEFEYSLKEDLLFNLKYLYYSQSIFMISPCYYHYVQHSQSLVHKRYPAPYMRNLITDLMKSGTLLADRFDDISFREYVVEEYMLSYAIIIFSMYSKNNGINKKRERMHYLKEYQTIKNKNKNIKIKMGGMIKKLFSKFIMMNPFIVDFILSKLIK